MTEINTQFIGNRDFLNPSCQHKVLKNYMANIFGRNYSVTACSRCLKLIQAMQIPDMKNMQQMI